MVEPTFIYSDRSSKLTVLPCVQCGDPVNGFRQCMYCFGHLHRQCGSNSKKGSLRSTHAVCASCDPAKNVEGEHIPTLPLFLFLLVSQATALHQFLNPPAPYPHPPPCTTVVLVARCLPLLNHSLHSKKTFFLPPPRHCNCSLQATGRVFCAGFLLAGPSSSPL